MKIEYGASIELGTLKENGVNAVKSRFYEGVRTNYWGRVVTFGDLRILDLFEGNENKRVRGLFPIVDMYRFFEVFDSGDIGEFNRHIEKLEEKTAQCSDTYDIRTIPSEKEIAKRHEELRNQVNCESSGQETRVNEKEMRVMNETCGISGNAVKAMEENCGSSGQEMMVMDKEEKVMEEKSLCSGSEVTVVEKEVREMEETCRNNSLETTVIDEEVKDMQEEVSIKEKLNNDNVETSNDRKEEVEDMVKEGLISNSETNVNEVKEQDMNENVTLGEEKTQDMEKLNNDVVENNDVIDKEENNMEEKVNVIVKEGGSIVPEVEVVNKLNVLDDPKIKEMGKGIRDEVEKATIVNKFNGNDLIFDKDPVSVEDPVVDENPVVAESPMFDADPVVDKDMSIAEDLTIDEDPDVPSLIKRIGNEEIHADIVMENGQNRIKHVSISVLNSNDEVYEIAKVDMKEIRHKWTETEKNMEEWDEVVVGGKLIGEKTAKAIEVAIVKRVLQKTNELLEIEDREESRSIWDIGAALLESACALADGKVASEVDRATTPAWLSEDRKYVIIKSEELRRITRDVTDNPDMKCMTPFFNKLRNVENKKKIGKDKRLNQPKDDNVYPVKINGRTDFKHYRLLVDWEGKKYAKGFVEEEEVA